MKNLKSLQVIALAGVAVALTAGCSSTGSASTNEAAGYRWVSSGGWVPITDVRKMAAFPPGWTPGNVAGIVSYGESYVMKPCCTCVDPSTTVATTTTAEGETTTVSTVPYYHEGMQPGDVFVEAAGANSDETVLRRVILYTPFQSTGLGH